MPSVTRPGRPPLPAEVTGAGVSRRGWAVVAGIFVMLALSAGLGFYGLSVYLSTLNRVKGFSVSGMSGATAIFFIVAGAVGVPIARLLRTVDPRPIVVVGAVVAATGLVMLGRVTALWQVYVVYAVFAVGYAANALVVSTTIVARWFHDRRAIALSVASTGLSVGGVLVTPVARQWLRELSLTVATDRLAVLYLAAVVPVALLLIRADPGAYGLGPDGRRLAVAASSSSTVPGAAGPSRYAEAIRSRVFVALTGAFLVAQSAQVGAIAQLVKLSDERISDAAAAGRTVSILAACSVIGRLLGGVVMERVGMERFTVFMLVMQAASLAWLAAVSGVAAVYLGTAVLGVTVGNVLLLHPLLLAHAFGMGDYPRIFARSQFLTTVGVAAGPFVYGWLHDHAGGYRTSYLVGAVLAALGFLAYLWGGRERFPAAD
jgi:MFS family permease